MLLIATDEAGYGPKLGPLVIAATVWRLGERSTSFQDLEKSFGPLRRKLRVGDLSITIDDSKAVYQPSTGLNALHAVATACLRWCGGNDNDFRNMMERLCSQDIATIDGTPWLEINRPIEMARVEQTDPLLAAWRSPEVELIDVRARVITARAFNEACRCGRNKADLLSESTLDLVQRMVEAHAGGQSNAMVFCDRHGGRRYYAAVLQHVMPDATLKIEREQKHQSVYRLNTDSLDIQVHFTVKGDSFTPVALASMHAKYIRERCMESMNQYFCKKHTGTTPLRPTAGYPVDADRFLADIEPIIAAEEIDCNWLVRCR